MRLERVQEALKEKNVKFEYHEEDGCGSLDFLFRGLKYHVWEYLTAYGAWIQIYSKQAEAVILREIMKKSSKKRF